MKNGTLKAGMVFAVLAAAVFTACPPLDKQNQPVSGPGPVEEMQITFGLAPGSLVDYMAKIDSDNARLIEFLNTMKEDPKGMTALTEDTWDEWMGSSYLKSPKLTWDGKTYEGKAHVVSAFRDMIKIGLQNAPSKEKPAFKAGRVHVEMEFLPYDLNEGSKFILYNKDRNPEDQIDFIGHIKTTLRFNPECEIESDMPHRRICFPDI